MAAGQWGSCCVPGSDEGSDSDEDWDFGRVPHESHESQLDQMLQADKSEALKKALFCGDVSFLEELLNSGVSVESNFQFGWTPLMFAASRADFAVVRFLLDRGANACFEIDKYTVLMAACTAHAPEENILKTVELLLSRNADPNFTCRRQMTALIYAAKKGCPQVVALLVAYGSHINAQDENGYSALIWAAQHGHKRVVFKLLELGADKNLQTKDEKTAADVAKISNHSEIYNLLSLAANGVQETYRETSKKEAGCELVTAFPDHRVGSYSTFGDLEVFLHGLGLEHIMGLLKEGDIILRQLLRMRKDELIQDNIKAVLMLEREFGAWIFQGLVFIYIGITNPEDQQKLLDAINELQVEERTGDLPELMKLELSEDEVFKFLQKLDKQCNELAVSLQTLNKLVLKNSHKTILQWTLTGSHTEIHKDLVCSVEKLGEEVAMLKSSAEKRNDHRPVKLPEKAPTLEEKLVKMGVVTLLGFSIFFFVTKLVVKKT